MEKAHRGRLLDVDLSTRKVKIVGIEEDVIKNYIGGLGIGVKILYDEVGPDVDPLSPSNVIIVVAGLLDGTKAPTNGRAQAITKSPYTGIIGRGDFGGWWGPRLKRAGFEGVVVRGKADSPVYIWIDDDRIEVRNAERLWGKDTWETTDALKVELGNDISVLAIGQAGENQVKFACPVADYDHAPGRSHTGCVMGTKNLKAIAVRGTKEVRIARPDMFNEAVEEAMDRINKCPTMKDEPIMGRHHLVKNAGKHGMLPCKNFQNGALPADSEVWDLPESVKKHMETIEDYYGYFCPLAKKNGCNLKFVVKEGPYAGLNVGGAAPSFPSWEWGAKCQIKSYPAMFKCRELCNRYGMDQSMTIPFALELFENGIITVDDTEGLELSWGNESAIHQLIGKIAFRQGLGDVFAEGSDRAAQKIGKNAEKYAMTLKGMEILTLDPRLVPPGAHLAYLVCNRGGDELDSTHGAYDWVVAGWAREAGLSDDEYLKWFYDWIDMPRELKQEIFGERPNAAEYFDRSNLEGKAAWVKWCGECTAIYNSLGLCMNAVNPTRILGATHFAKFYSAFTGYEMDVPEIMKAGDRIFHLMKAYIVREGLTRKDDDWPERFYNEPWSPGPFEGRVASREDIKRMLDDYYELQGWDVKTGLPTKRKLNELGLNYVADELIKLHLIEDGL